MTNIATSEIGEDDAGRPKSEQLTERLAGAKAALQSVFGQVVLAMSGVPRYRSQSLADLAHLVIDPMIRDRIAIAHAKTAESDIEAVVAPAAVAFWASVSDETEAKIREQIKAGVFPIRLKPDEWNSGNTVWLLDVIAPSRELATRVLSNFSQVAKQNTIKIHPMVAQLVDREVLQKLLMAPEASADVTGGTSQVIN
jgi:hemolysin-activating ACP:hemolysin acyltransferase